MLCECGAGSDCTSWRAGSAGRKMGEAVLGHGNCNSLGRVQTLRSDVSGDVLKQFSRWVSRAVRVFRVTAWSQNESRVCIRWAQGCLWHVLGWSQVSCSVPQTQICPVSPVTSLWFCSCGRWFHWARLCCFAPRAIISCLGQIFKLYSRKSLSIYFDTARVAHK